MMNVWTTFSASAAILAACAFSADAATVTATASTGSPAFITTLFPGASWSSVATTASTVVGTLASNYVSPFGDNTTPYFTVGSPSLASSPAELLLGSAKKAFKLLWGTVDGYNAIEFYDSVSASVVDTVVGNDVLTILGVPTGGTGAIVKITTASAFDTVRFYSDEGLSADQAAFEFALAPVPLPAAGLLLVAAVGGLGALRMRKSA